MTSTMPAKSRRLGVCAKKRRETKPGDEDLDEAERADPGGVLDREGQEPHLGRKGAEEARQ